MLKAAVDDVFRVVRLVGLRDEAAALGELVGDCVGKIRERSDRQMTDAVGGGAAIDRDLAGVGELGLGLGGEEGAGAE